MNPKVLISILNWFNFEETIKCVNSVLESDYPLFEIIIIDNHSTNASASKLREAFPNLNLVALVDNMGYAGGHQVAANYAKQNNFDLLWILNNDLEVEKKALSALVESYNINGKALYGSLVLDETKSLIKFAGGYGLSDDKSINFKSGYNIFEKHRHDSINFPTKDIPTSDVHGCSIMIPLQVIKENGFMDLKFFLYAEETDYCFEMNKLGIISIVATNSLVYHGGGISYTDTKTRLELVKNYYYLRNSYIYQKKYFQASKKQYLKNTIKAGIEYMILFNLYFYVVFKLFHKPIRSSTDILREKKYYTYLAGIHALLGIRGKTLAPNDFISNE